LEYLAKQKPFYWPVDFPDGRGIMGRHFWILSVKSEMVSSFLSQIRKNFPGLSLGPIFLCVLLLAASLKTQQYSGLMNLILHGRVIPTLPPLPAESPPSTSALTESPNFPFTNKDIQNLYGWTATFVPEPLSVDPKKSILGNCKSISQALTNIPNGGMDFRMHESFPERNNLVSAIGQALIPPPSLSFNFIGNRVLKSDVQHQLDGNQPLLVRQQLEQTYLNFMDIFQPPPSPAIQLSVSFFEKDIPSGSAFIDCSFSFSPSYYYDESILELCKNFSHLLQNHMNLHEEHFTTRLLKSTISSKL